MSPDALPKDPPPKPQAAAHRERRLGNLVRLMVVGMFLAGTMAAFFVMGEGQVKHAGRKSLSDWETRHLALAHETRPDLRLDFSRSFSAPLQKWLPHRTDGVVQPLWPWLVAWMLEDGQTNAKPLVVQAAWFQMGMTGGCLLLLGLICLRRFSLPGGALVVLLVGFGGFLPTVGEFSGVALFQILFLLTWATCAYGLQRNSIWVYGLAAFLAALAYLTVDKVLPLLVVFAVVSTARGVWEWLASHWRQQGGGTTLWVLQNHLLGLLVMAAVFLFVAGPRLSAAYQQFGSAFFNYRNHVRWLDDVESARMWIEQHPDRRSLETIPSMERLSLRDYQATHEPRAVRERLQTGAQAVLLELGESGGVALLGLALLVPGMVLLMRWLTPPPIHAGQRLHPETVPAVLFMTLAVGSYGVVAAWDAPVSFSNIGLSLLQPPLALGLVWAAESLLRRARRRKAPVGLVRVYYGLMWLLVGLQGWQVIQRLQGDASAP